MTVFPLFRTDFGKNIALGRRVFINSGCVLQDQGGDTIGDNVWIGSNVTVLAGVNIGHHGVSVTRRGQWRGLRVAR